jgi:hypothetical protein
MQIVDAGMPDDAMVQPCALKPLQTANGTNIGSKNVMDRISSQVLF